MIEKCCDSFEEALSVWEYGKTRRKGAGTKLNANSSRSHAIFIIKLWEFDKSVAPSAKNAKIRKFEVIDLAGMERSKKTGISSGERFKEANCINNSLTCLRRCLDTLYHNKNHETNNEIVPFRDSKLTRILSEFFNTTKSNKGAMILNVSDLKPDYEETLNVLKFSLIAQEISFTTTTTTTLSSKTLQNIIKNNVRPIELEAEEAEEGEGQEELRNKIKQLLTDRFNAEMAVRSECATEFGKLLVILEDTLNRRNFEMEAMYDAKWNTKKQLLADWRKTSEDENSNILKARDEMQTKYEALRNEMENSKTKWNEIELENQRMKTLTLELKTEIVTLKLQISNSSDISSNSNDKENNKNLINTTTSTIKKVESTKPILSVKLEDNKKETKPLINSKLEDKKKPIKRKYSTSSEEKEEEEEEEQSSSDSDTRTKNNNNKKKANTNKRRKLKSTKIVEILDLNDSSSSSSSEESSSEEQENNKKKKKVMVKRKVVKRKKSSVK